MAGDPTVAVRIGPVTWPRCRGWTPTRVGR